MPYTDSSVDNLIFNVMDSAQYQSLVNAGTVEENELYLITDGLDPVIQTTTNLVTSISSSSTDTQYPSAKAVYTALPKTTNDLTNNSGFITANDVPDPATIRRFTQPWSSGYISPSTYRDTSVGSLENPYACFRTVEASYANDTYYTYYSPMDEDEAGGSVLFIFPSTGLNYPANATNFTCTLRVRAKAANSDIESTYYDANCFVSEQVFLVSDEVFYGNNFTSTSISDTKYARLNLCYNYAEPSPDLWKVVGNEINTWSINLSRTQLTSNSISVKFEFGFGSSSYVLSPTIYAIDCIIEEVVS